MASYPSNTVQPRLLRAWSFIHRRSHFITSAAVSKAANIRHDLAVAYLQDWLVQGVLQRTPRYPGYVFSRTYDWQTKAIAQQLNRMS